MIGRHLFMKLLGQTAKEQLVSLPIIGELQPYNVALLICELDSLTQLLKVETVAKTKEILDAFYDSVSVVTERNHGDVQHMFQGRCYCVFGAPERLENPIDNARNAGVEVNNKWQTVSENLTSSQIHQAIAEGVLYCGIFGVEGRRKFEGLGDIYDKAERQLSC